MKKLFIVLGVSFLLTACGNDQEPSYDDSSEVSSEAQNEIKDVVDTAASDVSDKFDLQAAISQAIEVCNTQVESLPEADRAAALETCECTARNTDLEALAMAEKEQDFSKMQEIMTAGLQSCIKE